MAWKITSTEYLQQSIVTPGAFIGSVPFTVGLWAKTDLVGAATVIYTQEFTGDPSAILRLDYSFSGVGLFVQDGSGAQTIGLAAGTVTDGQWCYVLLRMLAGNVKYISLFRPQDGSVFTVTDFNAHNLNFALMDRQYLGHSVVVSGGGQNGYFAEFFYTNTDIQPDGLATQGSLVRQLALYGPWSINSVANDIIEYHAMKDDLCVSIGSVNQNVSAFSGREADDFTSAKILKSTGTGWEWITPAGILTMDNHPPVSAYYVRPRRAQMVSSLIV